jgi:hypothetical protein
MRSFALAAVLGTIAATVAPRHGVVHQLAAQEEVLMTAAEYVRSVVPEGTVRVNPERFPEPSAITAVARAIGGDVTVGKLAPCTWDRDLRRCVSSPDVRAYVTFQNLLMISRDSATVQIEVLEMPLEPSSPGFAVVARWVAVTVERRPDGEWEVVEVTMRAAS